MSLVGLTNLTLRTVAAQQCFYPHPTPMILPLPVSFFPARSGWLELSYLVSGCVCCRWCDVMLQLWSLQPQHITSNRRRVGKRAAAKSSWLTPCERTHDSVKVLRPKSAFMNVGLKGFGWECAAFKLSFCLPTSFLPQHNNSESASSEKTRACLVCAFDCDRSWLNFSQAQREKRALSRLWSVLSVLHNLHSQK